MPYLTTAVAREARSHRGLGQSTVGRPGGGTPEEWAAYEARIRWRRLSAQSGPRVGDWAAQAAWTAQVLRKLIAGEAVTVRPFPADPELLALLVNGRSWLLTMPEWELTELFPGLTPQVLGQARRLLLPGQDAVGIARAKLEADAAKFAADHARMVVLRAELQRYLAFAQDTLKQFQTYVTWVQHHERKKEKRTQAMSQALTAISTVLYFVPVVGWALGALVDTANVAMQLQRMKDSIAAMQAAGLRVAGAQTYVGVMEALGVAIAEVENARDEAAWMHQLTVEQLGELAKVPAAMGGGGATDDGAIISAVRGESSRAARMGRGALGVFVAVAGGLVALLALLGRKRGA